MVPVGDALGKGAGAGEGEKMAPLRRCVPWSFGGVVCRRRRSCWGTAPSVHSASIHAHDDKPTTTHAITTIIHRALVAGDVFLGGLLVSSLTKLSVRALEAQGALSGPAKEMQVRLLERGVDDGRGGGVLGGLSVHI